MSQAFSETQSTMAAATSDPTLLPFTLEHIHAITTLMLSLPLTPTTGDLIAVMPTLKTIALEKQANQDQTPNHDDHDYDLCDDIEILLQIMKSTMERLYGSPSAKLEIDETFRRLYELVQPWVDCELDLNSIKLKANSMKESSGIGRIEKLSLLYLAYAIEGCMQLGVPALDLKGRLQYQVECLPLSLGKLQKLIEIDFSENHILALPSNLGELKRLRRLEIHSNRLIDLPRSTGELVRLTHLNLYSNRLKTLPTSFGSLACLITLDLSSNLLVKLPDSIGTLFSLQRLNLASNDLEEIPVTIGLCVFLVELRLDFNRVKAIPESIGYLSDLKILTLRDNRLKSLPEAIGRHLLSLEELDLSFNELKSIPESLCLVRTLRKLNVEGNFVNLKSLPGSIGKLHLLEELDISNNQIKVLPDSFKLLFNLRVFVADETPLIVPPKNIAELGAQAVVDYMMAESSRTFLDKLRNRGHGFWSCILSMFCLDEML